MSDELGKKYPCFGESRCPHCRKKRQSSKAWADYEQQCKHCATNVIPSNLQRLFTYICDNYKAKWKWTYVAEELHSEYLHKVDDENFIDPTKEHREDLCENCQRLGRPCRETADQGYGQRIDWVPQSITVSTSSYRASCTIPQSNTLSLAP